MDYIKDAFQRAKQDINSLKHEINLMKLNITGIKQEITSLNEFIQANFIKNPVGETPTQEVESPTLSTHPSTHPYPLEGLKQENIDISTGNGGVPTDKQTDRQTNRQTQFDSKNNLNSIDNATEILDSLDNIKKEIRLKFKRLTDQEFLVFSTLYQLDEELGYTDYKTLSNKLNLTQSSIRDYIGRLMRKGVPVEKNKINNKNIQLSISPNLKKIATLSTILQLRGI